MPTSDTTLSDIFKIDGESAKDADGMKKFLAKQRELITVTTVPWVAVQDKLVERVLQLWNVKLADVLSGAWKVYRELQQFSDPKKYPSNEPVPVPLAEHEIISEHHPVLEIEVGGIAIHKVTFDLVAHLELKGCELTIQGGRIMKILVGECKGTATLAWQKLTLLTAATETIQFGKPINLDAGVPLHPAGNEAPQ